MPWFLVSVYYRFINLLHNYFLEEGKSSPKSIKLSHCRAGIVDFKAIIITYGCYFVHAHIDVAVLWFAYKMSPSGSCVFNTWSPAGGVDLGVTGTFENIAVLLASLIAVT